MFEANTFSLPITPELIQGFSFAQKLKVTGYCCKCGVKIPLRWNVGELDGDFIALESMFSEIWELHLPCMDSMVCMNCFHGFK